MPIVSVIIPVYNVEKYLRDCLDCAVGQTLRDIEIICLDDGSTDGSGAILDEYAARDSRIRVIHQTNIGTGASRNKGMALARGKYLYFSDADDKFSLQMLEKSVAAAEANSADVVVFRIRRLDEARGGKVRSEFRFRKAVTGLPRLFSGMNYPDLILDSFRTSVWNKLYRTSFVIAQKLTFQEIARSEDVLFVELSLVSASRIHLMDEPLYDYLIRTSGSLQATYAETPLIFIEAWRALKVELERRGIFDVLRFSFASCFWTDALKMLEKGAESGVFDQVYAALQSSVFAEFGIGVEMARRMTTRRKRETLELALTRGASEFKIGYFKFLVAAREQLVDANLVLRDKNEALDGKLRKAKEKLAWEKTKVTELRSLMKGRPNSIRGCVRFICRRMLEKAMGKTGNAK